MALVSLSSLEADDGGNALVAAIEAMAGRADRGELSALIGLRRRAGSADEQHEPAAIEVLHGTHAEYPRFEPVTCQLCTHRASSRAISTDRELVRQRIDAAAILFPDEIEPAALRRAQGEFEEGVGRDRLVKIDAEHHGVVVAADKLVDDLARDHIALIIVAQPCFHLMADDGLDLKDFALRRSARHDARVVSGWSLSALPHLRRSHWWRHRPRSWSSASVPSFISATATTNCGLARRMRVDTRGTLRCGTKWKLATSMIGFCGANTRICLTWSASVMGLSTSRSMGTV